MNFHYNQWEPLHQPEDQFLSVPQQTPLLTVLSWTRCWLEISFSSAPNAQTDFTWTLMEFSTTVWRDRKLRTSARLTTPPKMFVSSASTTSTSTLVSRNALPTQLEPEIVWFSRTGINVLSAKRTTTWTPPTICALKSLSTQRSFLTVSSTQMPPPVASATPDSSWTLSPINAKSPLWPNQTIAWSTKASLPARLATTGSTPTLQESALPTTLPNARLTTKWQDNAPNVWETIIWVSIPTLRNKCVWLQIRFRDVSSIVVKINANYVTRPSIWTYSASASLCPDLWTATVMRLSRPQTSNVSCVSRDTTS